MSGKGFPAEVQRQRGAHLAVALRGHDVINYNPVIVKLARDQYKYLVNRPSLPFYSEFSTDFQVRIQEVLKGKKTSDQALQEEQAFAARAGGQEVGRR